MAEDTTVCGRDIGRRPVTETAADRSLDPVMVSLQASVTGAVTAVTPAVKRHLRMTGITTG